MVPLPWDYGGARDEGMQSVEYLTVEILWPSPDGWGTILEKSWQRFHWQCYPRPILTSFFGLLKLPWCWHCVFAVV